MNLDLQSSICTGVLILCLESRQYIVCTKNFESVVQNWRLDWSLSLDKESVVQTWESVVRTWYPDLVSRLVVYLETLWLGILEYNVQT